MQLLRQTNSTGLIHGADLCAVPAFFVLSLAGDYWLFFSIFLPICWSSVHRFEAWFHGKRPLAIAAVYVIFLGALTVVILLAGPPFMQEAQELTQQAPTLVNNISTGTLVRELGRGMDGARRQSRESTIFYSPHRQEVLGGQDFVVRAAKTLRNSWWLLLVPILAVFFLKDGRRFGEIIINSVENERYRQIVASTIEEIGEHDAGAFYPVAASTGGFGDGRDHLCALGHARALCACRRAGGRRTGVYSRGGTGNWRRR